MNLLKNMVNTINLKNQNFLEIYLTRKKKAIAKHIKNHSIRACTN